jgi:hypothetical protein
VSLLIDGRPIRRPLQQYSEPLVATTASGQSSDPSCAIQPLSLETPALQTVVSVADPVVVEPVGSEMIMMVVGGIGGSV